MKHIELTESIDDMSEEDVRSTLADVMGAHDENVTEYSKLSDERDELETERDELRGQVDEAAAYFAERATETVNLPVETLIERFEFSEIREFAEQADDAGRSVPETEAEADEPEADESEPTFSEKPEQATVGGDQNPIRSMARSDLDKMFGGYDD
jgi:hypothetical protein